MIYKKSYEKNYILEEVLNMYYMPYPDPTVSEYPVTTFKTDNIRSVKDLYNDPKIMMYNQPYPLIPIPVGEFFKENTFEIELVEHMNSDGNIIDYTIGKSGIASISHSNLQTAIELWNNYCLRILKEKYKKELDDFNKFALKTLAGFNLLFLLFGRYEVVIVLTLLYIIYNYILTPNIYNIKKKAEEEMKSIITGYMRSNSSAQIKIAVSTGSGMILNEYKQEEEKCNKEINNYLLQILDLINKLPYDYIDFEIDKRKINKNDFCNIINNVMFKYKENYNDFNGTQELKDLIYYSKNFIKALNIISKYNNQNDDIKKEIQEMFTNYYIIFTYFSNLINKNNELADLAKLKVINQDSKMYKDYLRIKV